MLIFSGNLAGSSLELVHHIVVNLAAAQNIEHIGLMLGPQILEEEFLKLPHLINGYALQQSIDATIDDSHLFLDSHRLVLWLDEQALVLAAGVDGACRDGVDVATKLGERLFLSQ